MTVFLTILAGVSTFVLGQVLLKLIIDPIQEFKKTTSAIAHNLVLYANVYPNPKAPNNEQQACISKTMRELSASLDANVCRIPAYDSIGCLFGLPKRSLIVEAHRNLIALSNGYDGPLENQEVLNCYSAQHIREALGIHIPEGEKLKQENERIFIKAKSVGPTARDLTR